jgi:hypothetical protein
MAFHKKAKKGPETFHFEAELGGPTKLADEMRNLCHEIMNSFEARVAGVAALKQETAALLKRFHDEMKPVRHDLRQMAAELKRFLSHAEASRMRDFRTMYQGIKARQEDRNGQVAGMLGGFRRDRHAAASHLRSMAAALAKRRASAA